MFTVYEIKGRGSPGMAANIVPLRKTLSMVLSVLVTIDGMVLRMYQKYLPGFFHYR
jgi:hypothetical protein